MTMPATTGVTVANALLPPTYESAKAVLAECERIDECLEWANKAEALASYARQAKEDSLRKIADRIQARAIRRCGELLREYDGTGNNQHTEGGHGKQTQRQAAGDAGLSEHQQLQAVRVAGVPPDDFEAAVESNEPPSVTQLAEQGKQQRPLVDLQGRDTEDFKVATKVYGELEHLSEVSVSIDPHAAVRGTLPHEYAPALAFLENALGWLRRLQSCLEAAHVRGE